jgi:hypothetical protein
VSVISVQTEITVMAGDLSSNLFGRLAAAVAASHFDGTHLLG